MQKSKATILLLGVLMISSIAASADINTGLVAYYSFDDCTAKDNSGNGRDGIIQGNPQCVVARINKGFKFDGIHDSIVLQDLDQYFSTDNFSITYFFKNGNLLRNESIIGKRPICGNSPFFDIRAQDANITYEIDDGLGNYHNARFKTQLGIVFIAIARKGNAVLIYRNGRQVRQIVTDTAINTANTSLLGISVSPCIGVDGTKMFSGLIDELRVYNRALSESEIQQLHNGIVNASPLLSLGDLNNDGSPEIAVITHDATLLKTTATVKNAKTGVFVEQINFNGHYAPKKVNVVNDLNNNGASEIAVLGVRDSDQAVQVEVRDGLSGLKLRAVSFPATWPPLDLGIVRNINGPGTAGLAVLQQSDTALRVQLKDAKSGAQIRNISFTPGYGGVDLIALPDLNGNNARELAVLLDNPTPSGADKVEIRDSKTGALLRGIGYGSGKTPKQLFSLVDVNGNGTPELAVLREETSRVTVKDAQTGLTVNTLDYVLSQPYKLAAVADDIDGINDLALLGVRASDGQIRADVHSVLSDSLVGKVVYDTYGTTVGFISIPDVNGNGVAELVRLREQPGPQKLFAEIRDGRTGQWIQGVYF